ncbi:uncharacterized protein LOC126898870 [Daktulosphaira vitifoliae]|uniref:uncharacterized protein LOC126898870 n=1 Tax=Daktulosphaira vitifoliae TaxID=58002 RepID=UPI0021A9F43D|nr:uncharacterized protein LOC126898870 [Daktulosphaira vitifoliae]
MSSPLVVSGSVLQHKKLSTMSSLATMRIKTKSCACPLMSVDSSSCNEKNGESRDCCNTCSSISSDMCSIRLLMVLSDIGIFNTSFSAFSPKSAFKISQQAVNVENMKHLYQPNENAWLKNVV